MHFSRRTLLAGLTGAAMPVAACAGTAPPGVLREAMSDTALPGMAALVIRNFAPERELVAGLRVTGGADPVVRGDRWHIGSNGKSMTATLIARLVEKGALSWDSPIERLLPQFAETMHPSYRDVTLPDLLSHRSGLPENSADLDLFYSFYDDPAPLPAQRLRYVGATLRDEPAAAKRDAPAYSNTGFIIAAAAAEQATGRPYESLIVAEVFRPLHMRSVSFDQYGGAGEPSGHVDGRPANQPRDANPRMLAPAGGMRMTMRDWARFCIDQMRGERGDGGLLSAETYRFLHAGQGGTRSALGWGAAPAALGRTGPALTHAGSDGNWHALVALFPGVGDGVLVAANASDSMQGDSAALRALRALAATVAEPAQPAEQ